ncbi:hypothetical protein HMPREF0577_1921 [Mobiluncus mulieris ATCC 35243]|nr:hypothetical protein HMPREF0577_1921 [Mobiluncus mulieris ATCC 35243]
MVGELWQFQEIIAAPVAKSATLSRKILKSPPTPTRNPRKPRKPRIRRQLRPKPVTNPGFAANSGLNQ